MQQPLRNGHFKAWRFPVARNGAAGDNGSINKTECHNGNDGQHSQCRGNAFFTGHSTSAVLVYPLSFLSPPRLPVETPNAIRCGSIYYINVANTTPKKGSQISSALQGDAGWLLFVLTLQGQQQAARMRVWRALKAMRAAVLRDGVYLLPNRKDLLGALEAQAVDVGRQSGSAQIFMIDSRDERQEAEFRNLFDRTSDYQSTVKKIRKLRADLKSKTPRAISAQLMRLRREVETIAGQDFFPAEAANQSARALEELTVAAGRLLSPDEPQSVERKMRRLDPNKHKGRIWATRARPWADRLASAWLIRRFIDPDARFLWLKNPGDCPKRALGFDFDGAAFTHVGGKVTFEVLMESFNLDADSRLHRVAALIHYLDVGGIPVPEAAGVESLLRAARELFANDDVLLGEAAKIFELLYISYGDLDGDRN